MLVLIRFPGESVRAESAPTGSRGSGIAPRHAHAKMNPRASCAALVCAVLLAACAQRAPEPERTPQPLATVADTSRVYEVDQVPVKPQLRNPVAVTRALEQNYPAHLRDEGIGGSVQLRFTIQRDGTTRNIQVVRTSDVRFAAPAVDVVRLMRFTPGSVAGVPVRVRVVLPITFSIGS